MAIRSSRRASGPASARPAPVAPKARVPRDGGRFTPTHGPGAHLLFDFSSKGAA